MNARDLLETARFLTEAGPEHPTQAMLRRAVSTAYYAMFHCLASTAADLFIGQTRGPAWHRVYRSLEHGSARNACQNRQAMREFTSEVRDFADLFLALQEARQQADYALDGNYERADVRAATYVAEATIARFERVDVRHRLAFVAHVLFKRRPLQGCEMTEQQIREIAETAFKRRFPDVKLHRVNIWPRLGFEDDSPVVDVNIIYDGEYEQLNARGLSRVFSEVMSKAWHEAEDAIGFPCIHFFAKSGLERSQRDLATV